MNDRGFGAITNRDAAVLEAVMVEARVDGIHGFLSKFNISDLYVLEIGTHMGGTARGIKDWCNKREVTLHYTGIESGSITQNPEVPFDGGTMVFGDSIAVSHLIPGPFDLVFVDGDHGGNHVILETLLYGAKVRPGGFMLFHDTAPHIQQTMREAEGPDTPWFYNSVLAAHELMGFPSKEWVLWKEDFDPDAKVGGMRAYRKVG